GQTRGGLRNMTVRDCTFDSTQAGIRMKSSRGAGSLVEGVTYDHLRMKDVRVAILITSYYPSIPKAPGSDPAKPVDTLTPVWRHIRISNVTAAGSETTGRILGLPEMPVSDIVLTNVRIAARKGFEIIHARGVRFIRSEVDAAQGPRLSAIDAEVSGLDPAPRPKRAAAALPQAPGTQAGIMVAPGSGFKTVQEAIDGAPAGSVGHPTVIHIAPGVYKERIVIPSEKRFMRLVGED